MSSYYSTGGVGGSVSTAEIDDDAVTNAKLANMAGDSVKANVASGVGDPSDLAVGANTVVGRAAAGVIAAQVATAQVADAAVTLAKMADIATARFIGRTTAATGVPEALTTVQATALLDAATATLKGLVPAPPNNTTTFLRGDATFAAPAASGALTRAGGNTTEATTVSTTASDLLTVATLTIAVGTPVLMLGSVRKSTGAGAGPEVGVKLNTTVVRSTVAWGDNTNEAQSGIAYSRFTYGTATYLAAGILITQTGAAGVVEVIERFSAEMPTAQLTDVIWQARAGAAAVTAGMDDMHVYTHAVS